MRAPSLLSQCFPGLTPPERGHQTASTISDRGSGTPLPAVEVLPSKVIHPFKYGENVDQQGIGMLKGRLSVADAIGFGSSDIICSKPDGFLKSWDSSIDLVNVLKHEIRDGQLTFRGKRVLELGCNYGLPGIFACMKGASTVHFQDLSAEIIRCVTIPNVLIALEQVRDWQSRQPESPLTPSRQALSPSVHFYAGDWNELHGVLSIVRNENFEVNVGINFCFSEEESVDGCSSHEGSIVGQDFSSRRSRKLSGSRAWERASEADKGDGGYDVVLMAELPYSQSSLKKLYALLKKCLRPPYGVAYLATKRNYVGFNSGARHLRNLVDEEGILVVHLVKEMADRDVWKFFLKEEPVIVGWMEKMSTHMERCLRFVAQTHYDIRETMSTVQSIFLEIVLDSIPGLKDSLQNSGIKSFQLRSEVTLGTIDEEPLNSFHFRPKHLDPKLPAHPPVLNRQRRLELLQLLEVRTLQHPKESEFRNLVLQQCTSLFARVQKLNSGERRQDGRP